MTQKNLVIFIPSIEAGGVEKNFFLISNYLSSKIKNIYIITAEKNLNSKIDKKIKLIFPNSNFWRRKGRLRKYIICIFLLFKFLLKNKKSIIFSFQANLYAILVAKILNKRIISRSNSSPTGWSNNKIKKLIYKIGLNLPDELIVNSKEFQNEIMRKFKAKSTVIYNPLNKNQIIGLSKKKVKKFIPKKKLNIINVGRLVNQKDQITLLKAIDKIRNKFQIFLTIIGRGSNKKSLLNYIKKNKLNKIVKIFYTENPFPYIKRSDLFILSSKFEGLPNVLLEAIVLKKFIISSNCPTGPKEILDYNKGGLLYKVGDYNELSNKIEFYLKNKEKMKKKIQFAQKRLFRFDYDENMMKYLNLIKNHL